MTPADRDWSVLLVASLLFLVLSWSEGEPTNPLDPVDDNPAPPPTPLTLQPGELCSSYPDSAIATFEDTNLVVAVRFALLVGPQVDLTCGLVAGPTELAAPSAGVESLVGMQNLTSLTDLNLTSNSINDISSLSGLTSLTDLNLTFNFISDINSLAELTSLMVLRLGDNMISNINVLSGLTSLTDLSLRINTITDISALSGLASLTQLRLDANTITDISALSGLTNLTSLWLFENSVSDISALSGLTSLTFLDLHANSITDIGALSALTGLTFLSLFNNPDLTDIQPLLDNTGIGVDDAVDLKSTNVSCPDVAALEGKGVTVSSDCP